MAREGERSREPPHVAAPRENGAIRFGSRRGAERQMARRRTMKRKSGNPVGAARCGRQSSVAPAAAKIGQFVLVHAEARRKATNGKGWRDSVPAPENGALVFFASRRGAEKSNEWKGRAWPPREPRLGSESDSRFGRSRPRRVGRDELLLVRVPLAPFPPPRPVFAHCPEGAGTRAGRGLTTGGEGARSSRPQPPARPRFNGA